MFHSHLAVSTQEDMMLSDLDLYRAAHLMMHEHGHDAELEAARPLIRCSRAATAPNC
jgi:hypothetical protein